MIIKWIGAGLIFAVCGGVGFSMAGAYKREEAMLANLLNALEQMLCILEFQSPPLASLLRQSVSGKKSAVAAVLQDTAQRLEEKIDADAAEALLEILEEHREIPWRTAQNFRSLADSLGKFALSGQASSFRAVALLCRRDLDSMARDRDVRLRGYRTLGLCAGAALVILFL